MLTGPQFYSANLANVKHRIESAATQAGRDPGDIRLLAVAKQQPADAIRALAAAGQLEFGENYVQEASARIGQLGDGSLTWHYIGQIQGNKTRAIAELFDCVHTVDRERTAQRLNDQRPHYAAPLDVLLQVRLDDVPGKGGMAPAGLAALAEIVAGLPRLKLRGLMCLPEATPDLDGQREPFRRLRGLFDDLNARGHRLDSLSMGMSADLEAAVLEGSTIVRIGTALFGPRH